jgi:hypothetical protein
MGGCPYICVAGKITLPQETFWFKLNKENRSNESDAKM